MLNFLLDIKPGPLPAGRNCYQFNFPSIKPIDNHQKFDQNEIQAKLKELEAKRLNYLERLQTLEPIFEKVMRTVRKIKFGINALERFFNEPKPYKIFLKPDKYYTIDENLEKAINLLVKFDELHKVNCSINEAMFLHCEELKVTYKYMLELEWDLAWLDYQMEVIMYNKRILCEYMRKIKSFDNALIRLPVTSNLMLDTANVGQQKENILFTPYEDIEVYNLDQHSIMENEANLVKELDELKNQPKELVTNNLAMDEEEAIGNCKKQRTHFAALIEYAGILGAATITAIDPCYQIFIDYHDGLDE